MIFQRGNERARGGFGIVYEATDDNGDVFAQKVLNYGTLPPADIRTLVKRFEREVRYQEQLNHPNVVPILYHDLNADPPWFIMPLAIGSLEDDIRADPQLAGNPQKPLLDILAGLDAVHQKGFYHRDLKPSNVLKFRDDNSRIIYRISDFGLITPGAGQTSTLTASNMGGGTVRYRAPECANNFRRATAQADIYSFGAILHDIFGGGVNRVPHSELTVPGVLAPIVEKCTKSNVRRRYRSIASLREDLFNVLMDENIEFFSQEEEAVIGIIVNSSELTDEQWDRIFNLIDENADTGVSSHNIMRSISLEHILSLHSRAPDMFQGLGELYAGFAELHAFDFDYCDIISSKAQIFYDSGDTQLKAKMALAMLELGTSHNRWLVERQFMQMASAEIDDTLAERIKIEIEVKNVNFSYKIRRVEESIGARRTELHPILLALVDEQ